MEMEFSQLMAIVAVFNFDVFTAWNSFVNNYKKSYATDREKSHRFLIFWDNYNKILTHNRDRAYKTVSYELGVNKFSDLTADEFEAQMLSNFSTILHRKQSDSNTFVGKPGIELPSSVDWRASGAVTPVKDQGSCGSCWAFAAIAVMESQLQIKTGKLISLSEQNLIDCTFDYGNKGCDWGWPDYSFNYMSKVGIASEQAYPYEARAETNNCRLKTEDIVAHGKGFKTVPPDERLMQEAVATVGPICALINSKPFQHYGSGIMDEPDCDKANLSHSILIAGYGTDEGKDFWLIKNSWGAGFGESGYMRLARNANGTCGITSMVQYPIL